MGIYKCPSDKATVQTRDGTPLPQLRNRSYNMSGALGCEGTRDWIPGFYRFPEIIDPPPAKVFVQLIDVYEQHIMDAHFGIYPPNLGWPDMWIDIPAERHRQGANLSFADGHVEHWRWEWPKQHPHVASFVQSEADRRDLRRLQGAVRQRF